MLKKRPKHRKRGMNNCVTIHSANKVRHNYYKKFHARKRHVPH